MPSTLGLLTTPVCPTNSGKMSSTSKPTTLMIKREMRLISPYVMATIGPNRIPPLENVYVDWDRNAYQDWKSERAPSLWEDKARREWEVDETVHTEEVTDIRSDAARERRKKDSEQDMGELSQLMKMKEQINQQKIARKTAVSDGELEIEKVKAQAQIESLKT